MNDIEQLREVLVDLERARNRERQLRLESETLVAGLQLLAQSQSSASVFAELVQALKAVLSWQHAFVLVEAPDGSLCSRFATSPAVEQGSWKAGTLFARVLSGQPTALFDVEEVPEWQQQPEALRQLGRSALLVPLRGNRQRAILVCTQPGRGTFGPKQLQLARRFAPLASQALVNFELREITLERDRFFQLSQDFICVINADGRFRVLNPAWENILGFAPEQLESFAFLDLVHPEDRPSIQTALSKLKGDRQTLTIENRLRTQSGSFRWVSWTITAVFSSGTYYAAGRDITEKRTTEEVLRLNEARLQAMLELNQLRDAPISDLISFTLRAGVRLTKSATGGLALVNDEQQLVAQDPWAQACLQQLSHSDQPVPLEQAGLWGQTVLQRQAQMPLDQASKQEGAGRLMTVPVLDGDRVVAVVMVAHKADPYDESDVRQLTVLLETMWRLVQRKRAEEERLKLEEQLRQSQKMEAIGRLAGGVAHDINNVLGSITALASLIEYETNPDHPHAKDLQHILSACKRGRDLTRNLLGFARQGKVLREPISLNDTVREVLELLQRTLPKTISLSTELSEALLLTEGDPTQITHALMNLCINGADALRGKGTLTLRTSNIDIDEVQQNQYSGLPPGRYAQLQVIDTGVGMDEETAARAFEPFFTTKPKGEGSGLGLSMVYGTIKNHGGSVVLDSRPGQGTTVTVVLPAARRTPESRPKFRAPSAPRVIQHSGTVLIIDDEKLARIAAKRLMEKLGFDVMLAENGEAGVQLYRQHREQIALVLLDMVMPVMDGEETFRKLQELNPQVPVLLLSGYSKQGKAETLLELGARGFIQKPFNLQGLTEAVTAIMS